MVAQSWLNPRQQRESLEPEINFLAFPVPKLWPKHPKSCTNPLEK